METEFVAASETARELLGIQEMLKEVELAPTQPMSMHVDNQATICQIEGETSSLKAKHIDLRLKFVKDFARRGVDEMRYVRSELMLAHLLTKALKSAQACRAASARGVALVTAAGTRSRGGC
ncbi:FOG: Transposon-encoded proteins with TYA, reverse transcriptase, integrase domains in various combinations [Plasmopara halstedii]|uniref:FOG: Transposon-encoded proteins with TYA, reverse transcriptase, integrase domains in various combinations n=1 Tax=Plasmopara halstedii TaxID=4781 RepID=A0A0P1B3F1_PLAHL|nr:FOG: Transposon-encoded proteins with TYA, reverse transcriptase, integrase domains in various combinations [Plasmopara halstedii]CEG48033.1 FOG: Transposon-encoded proteins with TYA, reverse transcriptase, integrase domains in various combinations [Plasmopara halstedii]|eukprot:XP_024584402.1 FOG: Transposon-encoded proteins with TYA, reverse transcriptase, integrase domains in various combinations [Plasmopara halstedii]